MRALLWPLNSCSAWDQPDTEKASKTGEGTGLDSVRSVGVGSASHCAGGTTGDGVALASDLLVGMD